MTSKIKRILCLLSWLRTMENTFVFFIDLFSLVINEMIHNDRMYSLCLAVGRSAEVNSEGVGV